MTRNAQIGAVVGETLGAELIVDRLIDFGMPYVFGTCGHGNIGLLEELRKRQDDITTVSVHHEAVAGFMAEAYFRVTKQPVATFTSCGPGTANLPIALGSALRDNAAFLAITGNVPTDQFGRGPFQELWTHYQADSISATRPYVKRSFQATRPEQLNSMLDHAFSTMLDGRAGPVQLDVPLNVFREPVPENALTGRPYVPTRGLAPSGADVTEFLDVIGAAERPVIIAGELCDTPAAAAPLAELARRLRIPVATTPAAKSAVDSRLDLAVGQTGRNGTYAANATVRNADVLVFLGAHVDDRASSAWLPGSTLPAGSARFVQVDVDTTILGRNLTLDLRVVADPGQFLTAILDRLDADTSPAPERSGWLEQVASWVKRWDAHLATEVSAAPGDPEHPRAVVRELRRAMPDDAILLADVGVHHNWLVQEWPSFHPQTLLQSWGYASMGFGVSGVLGSALGRPDRPSVALVGDGGMLMFPSAVATAVEYQIPAVWVVWNNYAYASIRDQQFGFFGAGNEHATTIGMGQGGRTDFAMLARSMGAEGQRVANAGEMGEAVRAGIEARRPLVIEIEVDREIRPEATGSWSLPPNESAAVADRWLAQRD